MKLCKLLLVGIVAALLAGCSQSNYGGEATVTPTQSSKQVEDQIKKYENDPNMPPQAKQAAIAALRRSAEMGKGMKQDAPKRK